MVIHCVFSFPSLIVFFFRRWFRIMPIVDNSFSVRRSESTAATRVWLPHTRVDMSTTSRFARVVVVRQTSQSWRRKQRLGARRGDWWWWCPKEKRATFSFFFTCFWSAYNWISLASVRILPICDRPFHRWLRRGGNSSHYEPWIVTRQTRE